MRHSFSSLSEVCGSIYFPPTSGSTYPFCSLIDFYHNSIITTYYNNKLIECIIMHHTHIAIKFCSNSLPEHVSSFVNLRIYRTPSWVNSTVVPGYDISPTHQLLHNLQALFTSHNIVLFVILTHNLKP